MLSLPRHLLVFFAQVCVIVLFFQITIIGEHEGSFYIKHSLFALLYSTMGYVSYRLLINPVFKGEYGGKYLVKILLFFLVLSISIIVDLSIGNQATHDITEYLAAVVDLNETIKLFERGMRSEPERKVILTGSLHYVLLFLISGFVYLLVDVYEKRKKLLISNRQAELALLKSQINPHFLYNALNTIYGQSIKDNLTKLADSIQKISQQARTKVLFPSNEPQMHEARSRIIYTTAIIIGLLFFLRSIVVSLVFSETVSGKYSSEVCYKMMLNPNGVFVNALLLAVFSVIHFEKVFAPLWLNTSKLKEVFYKLPLYLLIMYGMAFLYWMVMNIQNELNVALINNHSRYAILSVNKAGVKHLWERAFNAEFYAGIIKGTTIIWITSFFPYLCSAIVYTSVLWVYQTKNLERQLKRQKKYDTNSQLLTQLRNLVRTETQLKGTLTEESLQQLVGLMKYVEETDARTKVPLYEEIQFIKEYIKFQRKRLPNDADIAIQTEFPSYIPSLHMAPMLLIPFIENAFQYGIRTDAPCWIHLNLNLTENQLSMHLANSVVPKTILQEKSGIGLRNVQKRLELIYPAQHTLQIIADEQTFRIDLLIQLETN